MRAIRRIAKEIRHGENIDAYLTIVVALVIATLNLLGVFPATGLTSLVLAVLGLLAIGTLATRARLDELREVITSGGAGPGQRPFPSSHQEDLTSDGDLWIYGVSRTGVLRQHYHHIADRLRAGKELRVLLVKPDSPAAELAEKRIPIAATGVINDRIRSSLELLRALQRDTGKPVPVKLTEQEMSFGADLVNPGRSTARLYLEYYSYKSRHDAQLRLVLTSRDGGSLEHYREQLDNLWEDAEPFDLGAPA